MFPNAAEEAKEKKRLTGREHREAMREKYGIKK
jgi:hypothetical protein